MPRLSRRCLFVLFLATVLLPGLRPALLAQATASLGGTITDPSGAILSGVTVSVAPTQGGAARTAVTNAQGAYELRGLEAGTYTITVNVSGFTPYVKPDVTVRAAQPERLDIALEIANEKQEVQVSDQGNNVSVASDSNISSVVVTESDLDAFSDDPTELESELLALAGPSVGPNGGQIYVDGFTVDAGLPPKQSIREVRVNQNPFSPEYDRVGYGRVEIVTKPGSNAFHGRFLENGNDLAFDTRDPFAQGEPGYYSSLTTANISGPLGKKASFFSDYQHRKIVNNAIVNAEVLGPTSNPLRFAQTVSAPSRYDVFDQRFDYALSQNNIFTASYEFFDSTQAAQGVGQFNLASQGYELDSSEHVARGSLTTIFGPRLINELRFQAEQQIYHNIPTSTAPELNVIGGFVGGGNTQGLLNYNHHHNEVDDTATFSASKHTYTFGFRLRTVVEPYYNPVNFNGTYTFSSLTDYANVLNGVAGATPKQFTLTVGNPRARVFSEDTGIYFGDDWRARPNLMFSYGLRFETQNYVHDHADWAPRLSVAYGIGRGRTPKTVLRGGFGIFYDRYGQQLQLQAEMVNGIDQTEYLINNPAFYPTIPTAAQLLSAGASTTIWQVQPNLHIPYIIQSAGSVERQVTKAVTVSVTYLNSSGNDQLISDNINAPLPGTYNPAVPNSGTRPFPTLGNIYQYQSAAMFRQNQLITNFTVRASRMVSLFGYYTLNHVNSDTAGPGSFPVDQYNIHADYGRAAFDIRDRVSLGGTINLKYGFILSPLMNFQSGTPFNVLLGQDLLGSTVFNQRPAFATASTPAADVVSTRYGNFNIDPAPGQPLVPINYGQGPNNFVMNLRITKTIAFGSRTGEHSGGAVSANAGNGANGGGPKSYTAGTANQSSGGGSLGDRGLGGGAGGKGGGAAVSKRYTLTLGAEARNLFNNVNLAPPVGNVTSPLFGESNGLQGGVYSFQGTNRRIDFQIGLSF